MATTTTQVTLEEARANAQALRRLHQEGGKSLQRLARLERSDPKALRYYRKAETFAEEAKLLNTNVGKAAKMRRIAEQYTADELEKICALVEKHRSRFGPTHLLLLLRVQNRSRRDRLMQRAIKTSWTTAELERAQLATQPHYRPRSGRRPEVPEDPVARLLTLDLLTRRWLRWCDAALTDLPEEVQAAVRRATKAMRQVQQAVEAELPDADK